MLGVGPLADLPASSRLILQLVRHEVDGDAVAALIPEHGAVSQPVDWPHFIDQVEHHRLSPLIHWKVHRLLDAGVRIRVDPTAMRILAAARIVTTRANDLLAAELARIAAMLKDFDARVIFRKGAHLAHRVYPEPGLRPMNDLDLLVPADAVGKVATLLTESGFREGTPADGGPIRALDRRQRLFWSLYGSDLPKLHRSTGDPCLPTVSIDVSTALMLPGKEYQVPTADVLRRAVAEELVEGQRTMVLAPEDVVLDLCLHLFKNSTVLGFMRSGKHRRLIKYVDLVMYLRSMTGVFSWEVLLDRAFRYGVERPVYYALASLDRLLPDEVPPAALGRLRSACPDPERFLQAYGQWDLPAPLAWSTPLAERIFDRAGDRSLPPARTLL
jgi:hypothetical protein